MSKLERKLLRRIAALNKTWDLIEAGDRVMVACSGGKDSWALLHLLRAYQKVVPFPFSIVATTLDQGQPGFDPKVLRRHFETHGFEHRIVYADTYSVVQAHTPPGKIHCSLCSHMRRAILHRTAAELGATKIALGHHRDDVVETVLLNMMYAGRLEAMPPKLPASERGCALVRPLVGCAEADLAAYAAEVGAPIVPCNLCGSQPDTRRQAVKRMLVELETAHPDLRQTLFASLARLRPETLYDPALAVAAGGVGSNPCEHARDEAPSAACVREDVERVALHVLPPRGS